MPQIAESWLDVVRVPENRSALRAARRLARGLESHSLPFAPLVLHGPTGVGKSLLVTALVSECAVGGRIVRIVSAHELEPRSDEETGDTFAEWLACDLLIVEDLQHLPDRAADWLRRLLDSRTARRRPTVFTANVGPAALAHLPRRLTGRLAAGLAVALAPLSPKSRCRIVGEQADRRGIRLTPDALRWLADHPTGGGLRPLLGMLDELKTVASGRPEPINAEEARRLLAHREPKPAGIDDITLKVAAAFDVKPKELLGPSRLRNILIARQVAMLLAHDVGHFSLPVVGRAFGRDHSTVLHAVRKVRDRMEDDRTLAGTVRQLAEELK